MVYFDNKGYRPTWVRAHATPVKFIMQHANETWWSPISKVEPFFPFSLMPVQVIVALSDKQRTHVPYRNSMMTMVLRDSLGGNCLTSMIATCSLEQRNLQVSYWVMKLHNVLLSLYICISFRVIMWTVFGWPRVSRWWSCNQSPRFILTVTGSVAPTTSQTHHPVTFNWRWARSVK